ncbi:MAG TPA: integrase core domain-containing protein, partial [Pseudolabrys sp.]
WQNEYCERAIGSIRRDCLDHIIVFGEQHLRHVLRCYASYYNQTRTHLSLNKDAPARRAVHAVGCIEARPVLGGLPINMSGFDFRQAQRAKNAQNCSGIFRHHLCAP